MASGSFEALFAAYPWVPIRGCPGRYLLRGGPSPITPNDMVGQGPELRVCRSPMAVDPVVVALAEWGGLISYKKADGRYIHTLNTVEGFARKCRELGIACLPPGSDPPAGV